MASVGRHESMLLTQQKPGSYFFDGRFWIDGTPDAGYPVKGYFELGPVDGGIQLTGHYYNHKGTRRALSVRISLSEEKLHTGELLIFEESSQCTSSTIAFLDSGYLMTGLGRRTATPFAVWVRVVSAQAWSITGVLHVPDVLPIAFEGKLLPYHSDHVLENVVSIGKPAN
jgi:hypothetical protein